MVSINLKVSMCRDIINIKKTFILNPCDSCNTDVKHFSQCNTCTLYGLRNFNLNVYTYVRSTYIVSMRHIIG